MTTQLFQADPIPSPHPLDPFKCCLYICGRDEEGAKEAVVVDGISCSLSGDTQFRFSAIPSSSCHLKYVPSPFELGHTLHTLTWSEMPVIYGECAAPATGKVIRRSTLAIQGAVSQWMVVVCIRD